MSNEEACCTAVRRFQSKRTGEVIEVIGRPDQTERRKKAVEQLWASQTRRYAVEHTRVEAFEGQIQDGANFMKLLGAVETALTGVLPGRFRLAIPVGAASRRPLDMRGAQAEIVQWILDTSRTMADEQVEVLRSRCLDCDVHLKKVHSHESRLIVLRAWDSTDGDKRRAERIRRALEAKIPKLLSDAQKSGSESLLVLESDDIALSNVFEVAAAFKAACEGLTSLPDLVFLTETDAGVPHVWVLKDGDVMLPHEAHYEDYEGG